MGPISGLAKITPKNDLESCLSDSFRDTAGFSIEFVQKKWVAKSYPQNFFIICLRLRVLQLMTH